MREMTIKEVAQALNISTQTVRRRIERGEYTARKEVSEMGERWLIPANQIKAAVKDIAVVNVTRQVTVSELQDTIKKALDSMVMESVTKEVEKVVSETVQTRMTEMEERLQEKLEEQFSNHYRLVDERLRQIMEARQQQGQQERKVSFWQRLFG